MSYVTHIQTVVNTAFADIEAAITARKLVDAPAAREAFLGRWVAQAAKKQRFHHSVKADLQRWVQRARSAGTKAALEAEFRQIQSVYQAWFPVNAPANAVMHAQLCQLIDAAKAAQWVVHTDATIDRKVRVISDGHHSLAVCPDATQAAFDSEGVLVKPLSVYVRGPENTFIGWAHQAGLAPTKVTAYKSIVKYHAESLIWPQNQADSLMVMPVPTTPK